MDGVSKVLQRISDIEQRFKPSVAVQTTQFADILAAAESHGTNSLPKADVSQVEKMVHVAAGKYSVDPRLAMAVAKTESGLVPDAVSTAGAVGVMQLMPETAQALGVRNLKDPRENIDGGVRYLKQLLATFDGDVTKSVAAYNAGPQAVRDYNGVPPYRETKEYVDKVLSLYQQG